MDVAFTAYRWSVTQALGGDLDGLDNILFGLGRRIERFESAQRLSGDDSSGPGPEILGREILAADFAQIFIHCTGINALPLFFLIKILKEILTRNGLTVFD